MKKMGFDCIEFKRNAQTEIYNEIKHLSKTEEITHFHSKAASGPLGEWWSKLASHAAADVETARCAESKSDYRT